MADNIKVVVRIRPLNGRELSEGAAECATTSPDDSQTLVMDSPPKARKFAYDWVGGQKTSQAEMFETIGKEMVECCISGRVLLTQDTIVLCLHMDKLGLARLTL